MARRLPIYFVLDVSESMAGEPIEQMEQVIDSILADLRRNPHALETVWFSQIVFATKAMTLSPLKEIGVFTPSSLPIGGGTGIGAMLTHLMKTLETDTQIDSFTNKADWKPIVYLMTDGRSTDQTTSAVSQWNAKFKSKCLMVAISLGTKSDMALLKQLTDNVIVFMDSAPSAYSVYADWISRSIERSIQVVSSPLHEKERPIADIERGKIESVETASASSQMFDDKTIVLVGRCQKTKKPYLLHYDAADPRSEVKDANTLTPRFAGMVPLKESYFELSGKSESSPQVDIQTLDNPGRCLHCGGAHGLVYCEGCHKISCGDSDEAWCCPWCGISGHLSALEGSAFTERGLG